MVLTVAEIITASRCKECLDTGLTFDLFGVARCGCYLTPEIASLEQAVRLSVCVWMVMDQGKKVAAHVFFIARLLAHATFESPLPGKALLRHFSLNARTLKGVIETLRDEWQLPIGARRRPPYGYYWINEPRQFEDWFATIRAQAISELTVAYRLFKIYYPELAGQQSFDFAKQLSTDFQEALTNDA